MMDQPSALELVTAVREFIEKHAMPELQGRTAFHARVAANALAIVGGDVEQAAPSGGDEAARLRGLLQQDGSLPGLNRELCHRIRNGQIPWNDPALAAHLVPTTLAKVAIDQPNYSGYVHSPHRK
jgi:hypothetical protein